MVGLLAMEKINLMVIGNLFGHLLVLYLKWTETYLETVQDATVISLASTKEWRRYHDHRFLLRNLCRADSDGRRALFFFNLQAWCGGGVVKTARNKITLLRVIPTMTFIHFLTGKSSGILSDISSDILFGILSGISSVISSGILSGKSSGILSGISSGILSDISSGILSDIFWHIFWHSI